MANEYKTHVFEVEMTCQGCSNAISNVLNKHKDQGISKYEVDLDEVKVIITSVLPVETLMEILKKSGKKVTYKGEKK